MIFELTSSKLRAITYCKNVITSTVVCLQKGTKTHKPLPKVQMHNYHFNLHLRLSIRNLSITLKNYGLIKGCKIFRIDYPHRNYVSQKDDMQKILNGAPQTLRATAHLFVMPNWT